jgi:alkylation response protein AidB-like acyl-CoA dehydrogenase
MYRNLKFVEQGWGERAVAAMEELAADNREELDSASRENRFPAAVYEQLGALGHVGIFIPKEYGGSGWGAAEYCLINEEAGRLGVVSPQTAVQGQKWLLAFGTDEQKTRYLPRIADGSLPFSESISEKGVGSSFDSMETRAVRDGDDWIITGAKTHVNMGEEALLTIVYAQTDDGLTAFMVEAGLPGYSAKRTDAIGSRLIPTADVTFDGVRVPDSALLGRPGQGMETFLTTFNLSRLGNASELIGYGRRTLGLAIDYARGRQVGSSVVTDFQGQKWAIADAHQALWSAALLRDLAATRIDADQEHALETTMAKNAAVDAALLASQTAFNLVGGHALYHEHPFFGILGDIEVLRTAGGSREVLRNFAARRILRSDDYEGIK